MNQDKNIHPDSHEGVKLKIKKTFALFFSLSFLMMACIVSIPTALYLHESFIKINSKHLQYETKLLTDVFNNDLNSKFEDASSFAKLPLIYNAIMTSDNNYSDLSEFLKQFSISSHNQYIVVYDIFGEIVASNSNVDLPTINAAKLNSIIDGEASNAVEIFAGNNENEHYIAVAVPINFNGYPEGVLAQFYKFDISRLYHGILLPASNIIISQGEQQISLISFTDDTSIEYSSNLDNYNIKLTNQISEQSIHNYIFILVTKVVLTILITLILSFIVFYLFGKQLIYYPFVKLGISERQVMNSNAQVVSILNAATDGIILFDEHGKIIKANNTVEKIFGLSTIEIFNLDYRSLFFTELELLYMEPGKHYEVDAVGRYKEIIPVEISIKPILDNEENMQVLSIRDMREKKEYLDKLKLFGSIIENAKDMVIVTKPNLNTGIGPEIVYVNKSFTKITGYTAAEAIGNTPKMLQGKNTDPKVSAEIREALEKNKSYDGLILNYTKDDKPYWIEVSIFAIKQEDETLYYTAIERDVTDKVEQQKKIMDYNENLFRLNQELDKSRNEALEASNMKSEFLAAISHEIRTPMTAILGNTEIIESLLETNKTDKNIEDSLKYLKRISTNSEHLLQVINDILDFSKIEAGKLQISPTNADVQAVLDNIVEIFTPMAEQKEIKFITSLPDNLPKYLYLDNTRLSQIIINLLSNAFKFTPKDGSVTLTVGYCEYSKQLDIEVQDTGIGIAKEKIENLFQAFTQADSSISRKFGGTGLGLAISKMLCNMMGGDIFCESKLDAGSKFSAWIIAHEAINDATTSEEQEQDNENLDFSNLRVLIAEDWPDNQELLKWHLDKLKVNYKIVDNGEQAVEAAANEEYNVIFLDIQMPVMDGETALSNIRHAGFTSPIIALTANVMAQNINHYHDIGFDDVVSKPFSNKDLTSVFAKYTNNEY